VPRLTVDEKLVEGREGASLLEAARKAGAAVPTLCAGGELPAPGSCMVCAVEERRAGRLLPSCATEAAEGMEVKTAGRAIDRSRREALDLLLAEHRGDCEGPCRRTCPLHLDVPAVLRLLAAGRQAEASAAARERLALAGVLGRICPAPCQKACRRGGHDGPLAIRLLHRAATGHAPHAGPFSAPPSTGRRVVVVGSGPTGLSAVDFLLRLGHEVRVLTREEAPGGTLRHPSLAGRLPAWVLEEEIGALRERGARFETGRELGRDFSLAEISREADEVVLATGGEGLRLAAQAVAHGRRLAGAADIRLGGKGFPADPAPASVLGPLAPEEMAQLVAGASPAPSCLPAGGEGTGFTPGEAAAEAGRCLHCDCRKKGECLLRERAGELGARQKRFSMRSRRAFRVDRGHPRLVYEPAKCIRCGRCLRVAEGAGEVVGLALLGRGFDAVVAPPFGASLAEALTRCDAEVARRCPTGAFCLKEER